ncbi:hypothetical protein ARMSODRAFT_1026905 [Armillaria solidipes]|uniref:Uncharacterized protein n=1 Tax=Armillaria solidipes TaxID=1076256 RepID=A0A2H3AMC8_9AGAR|nr:hypothetical protein ARMSODRAFT_1026905 [Armillaria solidipes]
MTFLVGSMGYGLAINIHSNTGGFVIAAGAILGICARLLRTTLGSLMTAYPTETQQGKIITISGSIFDLGHWCHWSVCCCWEKLDIHGRSTLLIMGHTLEFLILTLIGVLIPMLMANPNKMIRSNVAKVTTPQYPS